MKKNYFLTALLTILFIGLSLSGVDAQVNVGNTSASISGDEVCGATASTKCTANDLGVIMKGVLTLIISLGLPILVVVVLYRFVMAYFAVVQGNAGAYKEALKKSVNAAAGFFFIVALFGGLFVVILQFFGVRGDGQFNPTEIIKLFGESFVPHAYAQTAEGQFLPNPLKVNNLYDFILSIVRVVMRFFIYPMLIGIWVWTGFSFVTAQGNPEAISKAKRLLMWAFATTLVIFMLQAFLAAIRGTVQSILPGQASQMQSSPTGNMGTPDGRVAPAPGAIGSTCTINGQVGQVGAGGVCFPGRGAGVSAGSTYCVGKAVGTMCSVPVAGGGARTGTCSNNADGIFSCYAATNGDTCISPTGAYGTIDAVGSCTVGGRPLTGRGGSCQITQQCASGLSCNGSICQ